MSEHKPEQDEQREQDDQDAGPPGNGLTEPDVDTDAPEPDME